MLVYDPPPEWAYFSQNTTYLIIYYNAAMSLYAMENESYYLDDIKKS